MLDACERTGDCVAERDVPAATAEAALLGDDGRECGCDGDIRVGVVCAELRAGLMIGGENVRMGERLSLRLALRLALRV